MGPLVRSPPEVTGGETDGAGEGVSVSCDGHGLGMAWVQHPERSRVSRSMVERRRASSAQ